MRLLHRAIRRLERAKRPKPVRWFPVTDLTLKISFGDGRVVELTGAQMSEMKLTSKGEYQVQMRANKIAEIPAIECTVPFYMGIDEAL